ncbi:MAG TPA: alcohol dehydrogenase catalytic domain-containing protein [Dehalococcoidia bacterium]|nr:alcohol dehydrogenase catalytic domain-containing protein [Dehalococcoidia bacterium]
MGASLRALCTAPRTIELATVDVPPPNGGWATIRVRNCGICGSDLHFFRGDFPPPTQVVMGHEISGEVVELGEGATGLVVGDRVVVEPLVVCRTCRYCTSGEPQLCSERQLMGTAVNGGFSELMSVPAYALHQLPAEVPFHIGALAEPIAVCVHGLRLVDLRKNESVLVLGAGTIGLLSVLVARELGASSVAVTARHEHQASLAQTLGATEVFAPDDRTGLASYAEARSLDVVVETIGGEAGTLADALALVRPGGRISVLGVFTRPVSLHPVQMVLKEARIVGSLTYGSPGGRSDFAIAVDILQRRWRDLEPLITARFPLSQAAAAFEQALDKAHGGVKVTVEPGE